MAEQVSVQFSSPDGETLRVDWSPAALERLDPGAADVPWSLAGELDWQEIAAVRVFTGRVEDGGLAIAAIRPAGAAGHGDETVAGVLVNDEGVEQLDEVLLSTELDAQGAVRRIGLELYRSEGSMPLRIAGDARGSRASAESGLQRASTAFELRAAGATGSGRLDVITRT